MYIHVTTMVILLCTTISSTRLKTIKFNGRKYIIYKEIRTWIISVCKTLIVKKCRWSNWTIII